MALAQNNLNLKHLEAFHTAIFYMQVSAGFVQLLHAVPKEILFIKICWKMPQTEVVTGWHGYTSNSRI